MRIKAAFKSLYRRVLYSPNKYVPQCNFCKAEIFRAPYIRLCKNCQKELPFVGSVSCPKCGRKTVASGLCLACKANPPLFDSGFSVFDYEGNVRQAINKFKNGEAHLSKYFGDSLSVVVFRTLKRVHEEVAVEKSFQEFLLECLIVAVPLDKEREGKRGYNQAALLAEQVARKTGVPYGAGVIEKPRAAAIQKGETARSRAENAQGAYRVKKRKECKDKYLLVIDDIMTTGATGSECSRVLKLAGAKRVLFFSVAAVRDRVL